MSVDKRARSTSGELPENLVVFGKPIGLVFAEDHLAVDDDVKDSACAFDEIRVNTTVILDCGGQTGRLGFVVSLHAVGD